MTAHQYQRSETSKNHKSDYVDEIYAITGQSNFLPKWPKFHPWPPLSGVGNRLKMIHVHGSIFKGNVPKSGGHDFARSSHYGQCYSSRTGHFSWYSLHYHPFSLDDVIGQFPVGATNVDFWAENMPPAI